MHREREKIAGYSNPKEVSSLEELLQFYQLAANGEEEDLKHVEENAKFATERATNGSSYYFAVKKEGGDGDGEIAGVLTMDLTRQASGSKELEGYIGDNATAKDSRGKGLASNLDKCAIEKAKELGCSKLWGYVKAENISSLVVRFNEGFVIDEINQPSKKGLFCRVTLDLKPGDAGKKECEWQEVNLGELVDEKQGRERLGELLKQGWVGVDLKNLAEATDNNPKNWVMIFERVKVEQNTVTEQAITTIVENLGKCGFDPEFQGEDAEKRKQQLVEIAHHLPDIAAQILRKFRELAAKENLEAGKLTFFVVGGRIRATPIRDNTDFDVVITADKRLHPRYNEISWDQRHAIARALYPEIERIFKELGIEKLYEQGIVELKGFGERTSEELKKENSTLEIVSLD